MNNKKLSLLITTFVMLMVLMVSPATFAHDEESKKPVAESDLMRAKQCDVNAGVQQCCSASKCSGKVLSNRDAHNCKVKSRGKSWHNAAGRCTNRL